jgi:hypothetical protein
MLKLAINALGSRVIIVVTTSKSSKNICNRSGGSQEGKRG